VPEQPLALNQEQQAAVDTVLAQSGFNSYLLDGVTGSGKTEVYLQLIAHYLQQGQQVLVLVPEIGLTPQTLSRFRKRFSCPIDVIHSGLTDRERLAAWQLARNGQAGIIIGTRSAVFTPLARPGLIIVDEEHDGSLKQQDGFRYSARDIAIKRAYDEQCPIVLGSATPSLETLHNVQQGRYQQLILRHRATGAPPPKFQLLDIRKAPLEEGFSQNLLASIKHARLTTHFQQQRLRCHHCEHQQPLPQSCPDCRSSQLHFQGIGTERSERFLQRQFPGTPVYRIDRDTTSRKDSLAKLVDEIHNGEPCILVGTQMLAKGHHFPDVTLVAMLDIDGGLFSADFRGPERMGQLLVQVAGRSGRANKPGQVIIQSHQPDHPLLQQLLKEGYGPFAQQLLAERQQLGMPPSGHIALIRADASKLQEAEQFLHDLRQTVQANGVQLLGPLPSPMTKRAGRFRAQLMLHSTERKNLHGTVKQLLHYGEQHTLGKRLQWSVDIDPMEMF
jgi:primosomal protein N' (replication factor Y)